MGINSDGPHIGRLTTGITSTLAEMTIKFVYKLLPEWRDDPDRPIEGSENKLNLQLCKYLDSYARNIFPMVRFNHEEYQSYRRSIDLSASSTEKIIIDAKQYSIYEPFLVFECKRLPAPSKDREKEYVTGGKERTSGGIQRFKIGEHGAGLNQAVMVGYIQERSLKAWHYEINKWITALAKGAIEDTCDWDTDEKLKLFNKDESKGLANYWSFHSRTGSKLSNEIKINHLWIVMHGN